MKNKLKLTSIERLYSNLFFFFFVAQIFSPYIYGATLYIEVILVCLNPFFINWILKLKTKKYYFLVIFIFLGFLCFYKILLIKIICIFLCILFLLYTYERDIFYLKKYLLLSIFIAIVQFLFLYTNPKISYFFGPSNLSQLVWEEYATPTFTNFYRIFLIPRVSGLSREAGFFASLLTISIFLFYIDAKIQNKRISIFLIIFWLIGFIISFSKMSMILFIFFLLYKNRKHVNIISPALIFLFFIIFMYLFVFILNDFLIDPSNFTFLHRFGGFGVISSMDFFQILFGVDNIKEIYHPYIDLVIENGFSDFAGLSGFIINYGLIFTILYFLLLCKIFKFDSFALIALLLMTINVDIVTNQNFVILTYFFIILYLKKVRYAVGS